MTGCTAMAQDNNSFITQEEPKKPDFEERKKDMVQFSDAKQVKKKPENAVWKWIRDMFFSGRTLKEILKDVAENQIVPQMKDNFRNSLVSMIDLGIYKDHSSTSSTNVPGSFITNYVNFSDKAAQQKKTLEANKQKEKELISSGYETPAFKQKVQAENFLKSIHAYVTKYQTMTVQDMAWMQGKTVDYTWDKYGWEKEEVLAVKNPTHINNPDTPWAIILPKAHVME